MILRQNSWKALVLGILLSAPCSMFGQSGAGSIQGTVQDASGAALPGSAIHVVNVGTGVVNDATSNGAGFYAVQGLFAGKYTVTYSAAGMKKYQTTVDLQDAQNAVLNPKLTVGDVTEQVTVAAEDVQLVTLDSGTVSTQLDFKRIDQLPQNGRSILVRFISREKDADHASSEQYFSDDGGRTWELNWVNEYTRTKG